MIAGQLWLIYALAFGATLLGVQALYWVLYEERRDQIPAVQPRRRP
jgi:hypothetical protein